MCRERFTKIQGSEMDEVRHACLLAPLLLSVFHLLRCVPPTSVNFLRSHDHAHGRLDTIKTML
jgi:hypothetical protein